MQPRVSIIVPVYNVESYIEECLQSVADQTVSVSIECLVVDDKGTDNSISIAKDFVLRYKGLVNFRIITRDRNGGLSAARNTGICEAKGEYLYFLDSDDCISNDCIEKLWMLTQKYPGVELVQGTYDSEVFMLRDFSLNMHKYSEDCNYIKSTMLDYDKYPVMAQNRLVKRELIIGNNLYFKEGIIHEDNYWTFFLAKHVSSLAVCESPVYRYRSNPDGIMGRKNIREETKAFQTFICDFSSNIDSFLSGNQKVLVFNYLITLLKNEYYADEVEREKLIETFSKTNSFVEKMVLKRYLLTGNVKIMHLLIRLYKLHDLYQK